VSITVHGALPEASLLVAVPSATHALALAFDVAGGVGRGRQLAISAELTEGAQRSVTLLLPLTPPAPSSASELLAIVSFAITRDGGAVWCADDGSKMMLRLPVA
jgi:hypothetical protein